MQFVRRWFSDNQKYIKKTYTMAWPSVIESFFVAFVGIVDLIMVSKLGEYAVAAVGLTTQPKFIGLALFIATNVAVSALVARRRGEEDREGAGKILLTALLFVLLAGILVSVLCVIFANQIIRFAGSEADTHKDAVIYFSIIMGGMIFNIISLVINAAQRGSGNTRIAMKTNLTSNLVNIVFNYLLIEGKFGFPAWGVKGAAIATVIGTVIACGMSIASLFKKDSFLNISYMIQKKLWPAISSFKQLFSLSSNVFIEQLLLRIGFMSVSVMAAKLGTRAFAAHQVGMNIMSLSFSFGDGMQVAAVTLIGQSLGQKKPELAKKYGNICQRIGNLLSVILSVLYLLFGEWYYRMFFTEEATIHIGVDIMRVMVLIVLMQVSQVIYMGCLRGAGDVRFTMIASTISVTCIRPIMSYVFAYGFQMGIIGIWMGIVCDQITRLILTQWRFKQGNWTKIKI